MGNGVNGDATSRFFRGTVRGTRFGNYRNELLPRCRFRCVLTRLTRRFNGYKTNVGVILSLTIVLGTNKVSLTTTRTSFRRVKLNGFTGVVLTVYGG